MSYHYYFKDHMQSIFSDIMAKLPDVSKTYLSKMSSIDTIAKNLRIKLLEEGKIVKLEPINQALAKQYSLCAIDGASAMEKLQSGDLMIASSTLAEGINSKPIYGQGFNNAKPHSSFAYTDVHTSKNDQILSGMRAFTEISILGQTEHDIAIIDGSYLGNFLTVLYQLQDSYETASVLIEYLRNDTEQHFIKGLERIFDTSKQFETGKFTVALAKSDSSREMVNRYVGKGEGDFLTDKMLAEYLLKPGEMLVPASVRSNTGRVKLLTETDDGGYAGFKWDLKTLSSADRKLVDRFFGKDWNEDLYSMYTYLFDSYRYLYFKPSKAREGSNPLRVEFIAKSGSTLIEQGVLISNLINADMVVTVAKEPHCQYMVDQEVKKPVSRALTEYRSALVRMMNENGLHVEGVATNYRT